MTLRHVRYYETEEELAEYYGDVSPSAHIVDMGVELEFDSGQALSFFWVNPRFPDGEYAGHLVSVERPMKGTLPGLDRPRYEVGSWPEWQPLVGRQVEHLEHVGHPRIPWRIAVRLHFDDGNVVTVALGETTEAGDLTYSIDTMLVFHDDRKARSYLDFMRNTWASFSKVLPATDLPR